LRIESAAGGGAERQQEHRGQAKPGWIKSRPVAARNDRRTFFVHGPIVPTRACAVESVGVFIREAPSRYSESAWPRFIPWRW
jgi:hypothetical protein